MRTSERETFLNLILFSLLDILADVHTLAQLRPEHLLAMVETGLLNTPEARFMNHSWG